MGMFSVKGKTVYKAIARGPILVMDKQDEEIVPVAVADAPTNGNVILSNELHPENAESPIYVTLFGITIEVKELHPENA